jgi:hypothetical protein
VSLFMSQCEGPPESSEFLANPAWVGHAATACAQRLSLRHFEPKPSQKYAIRQNGYPTTPGGIMDCPRV